MASLDHAVDYPALATPPQVSDAMTVHLLELLHAPGALTGLAGLLHEQTLAKDAQLLMLLESLHAGEAEALKRAMELSRQSPLRGGKDRFAPLTSWYPRCPRYQGEPFEPSQPPHRCPRSP